MFETTLFYWPLIYRPRFDEVQKQLRRHYA
jgi:hypothetical protein